jgi:hypothetical protein
MRHRHEIDVPTNPERGIAMREIDPPALNRFQRHGAVSNTHVGRDFEYSVRQFLIEQGLELKPSFSLSIGHQRQKPHRFDLGTSEPAVVVECKSYTWTSGGNSPSAKLRSLNEAMLIFSVTPARYRKMLVMLRHLRGEVSLAAHYIRNQGHLIPAGVEVWELDPVRGVGGRLL